LCQFHDATQGYIKRERERERERERTRKQQRHTEKTDNRQRIRVMETIRRKAHG